MRNLIFAFLILILLSANVYSLAVASDFLEDDTIQLIPGGSTLYGIRLQNPNQYEIKIKLTYDDTFLHVIDYQDEYTVPPKTNYPILFNVSAPEDAKPNQEYAVSYTIHELSGSGPGVPILIKIAKNFKLKVIKDPNKFYIDDYYKYIPYVAVILLVIYFLLRKEFSSKKFRRSKVFGNRKIIKWKH